MSESWRGQYRAARPKIQDHLEYLQKSLREDAGSKRLLEMFKIPSSETITREEQEELVTFIEYAVPRFSLNQILLEEKLGGRPESIHTSLSLQGSLYHHMLHSGVAYGTSDGASVTPEFQKQETEEGMERSALANQEEMMVLLLENQGQWLESLVSAAHPLHHAREKSLLDVKFGYGKPPFNDKEKEFLVKRFQAIAQLPERSAEYYRGLFEFQYFSVQLRRLQEQQFLQKKFVPASGEMRDYNESLRRQREEALDIVEKLWGEVEKNPHPTYVAFFNRMLSGIQSKEADPVLRLREFLAMIRPLTEKLAKRKGSAEETGEASSKDTWNI